MALPRVTTPVLWDFAPEWLTGEEACHLSGHDGDILHFLIDDGGVDAMRDGHAYLVEKASLYEFRRTLAEVLHWWG